jgi:hypothetical protein
MKVVYDTKIKNRWGVQISNKMVLFEGWIALSGKKYCIPRDLHLLVKVSEVVIVKYKGEGTLCYIKTDVNKDDDEQAWMTLHGKDYTYCNSLWPYAKIMEIKL